MPALQSGPEPSMVDIFYVQDVARRALHGLAWLVTFQETLYYDGPLPATCHPSSSFSLGMGFWKYYIAFMFEITTKYAHRD